MGALRVKREAGTLQHGALKPASTDFQKSRLAQALITPTGPNLSTEDRIIAESRFAVIEPLLSPSNMRKGAVIAGICQSHGIPRSTVYSWLKAFNVGGLPALVKKDRFDKGKSRKLNNAALEFIVAAATPLHGAYGSLSVREIFRAYEEERVWRAAHKGKRLTEQAAQKYHRYIDEDGRLKGEACLTEASYPTFLRWFNRIPSTVKVMARGGGEAYANTQEILSFRNLTELQPLDYVVMDHRQLDLFCLIQQSDGWKLARPWLTAAIDMRTRKWLAWDVVESPSSDSIASVLKQVFLKYGLPAALYWDNGKDFRCEWFEGKSRQAGSQFQVTALREGVRGVLETLNVRVHHAIVRRARSKIIEPNFVNTANFDRSLPEWCGHKPTERPERFGDLLTQHERWVKGESQKTPFQTISQIAWLYGEFLDKELNERPHTGEGMNKVTPTGRGWMCPNECWERLIGRVPRRWAPPEVIQFCFRKRRESTVRNGEVRITFAGREYHYRVADNPTRLMSLNGRKVETAYDPHDLETVAIYHDGCFIGLAANLELRRMGEQTFVEDERQRRSVRREVTQFIKDLHTAVPVATAEERALRRIAVVPARQEPQRIELLASMPDGITDAIAAAAVDRAPVEIVSVERIVSPEAEVDDEFNFFS